MFHDIEQNSEEWYALWAGKLTCSKLGVVMANFGKAFGEPAKKYAVDIAIEQITGEPVGGGYSNAHMERGHEEEPIARMLYEAETFTDVTNGGFFDFGNIGCSPDGLCGDGVIEIKSAIPFIHYERIRKNSYDSQYKWQLIGNMKYTGKDWIDFISYCGDFPEGKRLYINRLYAKDYEDEFLMIDSRVSEFFDLVEESRKVIKPL